jgi:hypothetical protein
MTGTSLNPAVLPTFGWVERRTLTVDSLGAVLKPLAVIPSGRLLAAGIH